jgi:preprotein translocase subunit SecG
MIQDLILRLVKEIGYDNAIHLKHFSAYSACFMSGILLMVFYNAFAIRFIYRDDTLDGIGIVRLVSKDGKIRLFANMSSFKQNIHTQMSLFLWFAGLRKTNITWTNTVISQILARLFIILTVVFMVMSILLSLSIVASPSDHNEVEIEIKDPLDPPPEKEDME